jgi:hypothetical protein
LDEAKRKLELMRQKGEAEEMAAESLVDLAC